MPIYEEMPDIDKMYEGYFSVVPYVFPGTYVAYAFSYTGGALMQWCVETFAGEAKGKAREQVKSHSSGCQGIVNLRLPCQVEDHIILH